MFRSNSFGIQISTKETPHCMHTAARWVLAFKLVFLRLQVKQSQENT